MTKIVAYLVTSFVTGGGFAFGFLSKKSLLYPSHTFGHSVFGVAERDPQEAFRLVAECDAWDSYYAILQALLGDFEIVAKFADIQHRVERALGRGGAEASFFFEKHLR